MSRVCVNPSVLLEPLRRAVRALLDTPLRSLLTMGGIVIGIAALFSLLSIAEGIRSRIVNEWLSSGLRTSLSVMPQGSPNPLRGGPGGRRPRTARIRKGESAGRALDDATVAEIARIEGVRRVWPVVSRPVMLRAPQAAASAKTGAPSSSAPSATPAASVSPTSAASSARPSAISSPSSPAASSLPPSALSPATPALSSAPSPVLPGAASSPTNSVHSASPVPASSVTAPSVPASLARAPSPSSRAAVPAPAPTQSRPGEGGTLEGHPDRTPEEPPEEAEYATLRGFETDFFWAEDYIRVVAGAPLTDPGARQALLADDCLAGLGFKDAPAAVGKAVLVQWREPAPEGSEGAQAVPGLPFSVALRSAEYRIVGVFEKRGSLSLHQAGIIVPVAAARKIATFDAQRLRALFEGGAGSAGYPGLDVYLTPGADLEAIESRIKAMGFETLSGAEIVGRIRRSILILQAVLGGLGTIAIAVATLGIANTMLTAVYERMREIGVMKAVGARRRDIRRQFFAEAGLIGFTGGLVGLAVGFGADHLLALIIGQIARRQGGNDPGAIAVHTPLIALGCLGFSVALSLLAGTFPAARAARLDPVQTLRHE